MQLQSAFFLLTWLGLAPLALTYTPASTVATDALAAAAKLNQQVYKGNSGKCTPQNAYVRKEWSTLSVADRKAYTNAVLCLMSKPPKGKGQVPGIQNRFDDFVATHIQQTPIIHGTTNFLTWHRYYTWVYEQTLRNECGYTGYQPYWNWGKSAYDPINSPYFDGSEGSMSGNGVFEAHTFAGNASQPNNFVPGQGGGCVKTGPFKDIKVNLGPVLVALIEPEVKPNGDGLAYNPRCMRRDISVPCARNWTNDGQSFSLITQNTNVGAFQDRMQGAGNPTFPEFFGVHTGGHLTYIGDPAGDLFSAPGDPMFFLHHAQIDRTYWIWQNLDPWRRTRQLAGTITTGNMPPSRNGTAADPITLTTVGAADITVGDALDTMAGPFCYRYE